MTEKEFKSYLDSRKFVFCKTPEELRKALIKFEWKKEDKMDGKTKTINEIERKISGTIQHIVLCVDELVVALKELMPKAIEEKEIVLKDGQIYRHTDPGCFYGTYYLLIVKRDKENKWKLVNLSNPEQTWSNWRSAELTKSEIEQYFTLCPTAFINVIRGDYGHSGKE
jgi:hypothetical protein